MTRVPFASARQRGVALITAIFVVALAVIAGVAMFEATNLGVHRTANIALTETAWWYAEGIESWVKWILLEDEKLTPNVDSFADIWAQPVPFLPIENGAIRGRVEDLQGRFNLNNLAAKTPQQAQIYLAQFQRLIDNLPNFDASRSVDIGTAVRDWISSGNENGSISGAKDGDYLSLTPAYRAAAQPMASISELLLVKGMTPELFNALKPYVAALPVITPVNVNTALPPVLMSLAANIDRAKLERFVEVRVKQPATGTGDVSGAGENAFIPAQAGSALTGAVPLSVTSNYFELQAEIAVGSGRVALYSVISRPTGGVPVVIAHNTGTE